MKSLVEKIIDVLNQKANEHGNPIVGETLRNSIEEIKQLEEDAEFEEVARVMMKHLCTQVAKYHPHHTVILTGTTCELVEGVKTVGLVMDYVVD